MANSKQSEASQTKKQKPGWRTIMSGEFGDEKSYGVKIEWCAGCGCLKITRPYGQKILYRVPRREAERRVKAKGGFIVQDEKTLNNCCRRRTPAYGAGRIGYSGDRLNDGK